MTSPEQLILVLDTALLGLLVILIVVCRKPRHEYDYRFKDPGYLDHILHQNWTPHEPTE